MRETLPDGRTWGVVASLSLVVEISDAGAAFPSVALTCCCKTSNPQNTGFSNTVILLLNVGIDQAQPGGSHLGSLVWLQSGSDWAGATS